VAPPLPPPQAAETPGLSRMVGRLARVLGDQAFPTGERARLRRWSPGAPPSLAFLRFGFSELPEGWQANTEDWEALVAGLALMYPQGHDPGRPAGRALAEAGYAEARLERLLAADGDTLRTLLLRAARFLRAKNASCSWIDFAFLLGLGGDPEAARRRLAGDYFRALSAER